MRAAFYPIANAYVTWVFGASGRSREGGTGAEADFAPQFQQAGVRSGTPAGTSAPKKLHLTASKPTIVQAMAMKAAMSDSPAINPEATGT